MLSKLPGIGSRSAKRLVLHLLKYKDNVMFPLADALMDTANSLEFCEKCGNLDEGDICVICRNQLRNQTMLCVVESVSDLWALEKTGVYKGLYHVLGGTISAVEERDPKEVNIDKVVERVRNSKIMEIIIATNATMDGQTTAFYLCDRLRSLHHVRVTRLANGIPVGGELDYLDEGTIAASFNRRLRFD